MSTKIFDVYLWNGPLGTFDEIHTWLIERKQQFRQIWADTEAQYIARKVSFLIDTCADGTPANWQSEKYPKSYLDQVIDDMRERRAKIKQTRGRDIEIDFEFEVWIVPSSKGFILRPNTEQREWMKLFIDTPFLIDYHYQNCSDKPEEISDDEWREREKFWDELLPSGIFSDICLTFQMHPSEYDPICFVEPEKVLEAIPSVADRARRIVWAQLFKQCLKEMGEGPLSSLDFIAAHHKAEGKEMQEERDERIFKLSLTLPKITKDDLYSKPPCPITLPE